MALRISLEAFCRARTPQLRTVTLASTTSRVQQRSKSKKSGRSKAAVSAPPAPEKQPDIVPQPSKTTAAIDAQRPAPTASSTPFLYHDAVTKRIEGYLANHQVAELQVLLSRCASVDVSLTLSLRRQLEEQNVPIPDYLHLTVLSHLLNAVAKNERPGVAAAYLADLTIEEQARICHLPLQLFSGVERETTLSSSAKFVFERRPLPALTPDALFTAKTPVSPKDSRLFDLAGPQGWALADSLAPHVALSHAALAQLPPVLASLLLDPLSGVLVDDTVLRRDAIGPVLQSLSYCSAQEAARCIPPLLNMAVHNNILLTGLQAKSLLAMPNLTQTEAFTSDWLADLCYGLHLSDCHFSPSDVDAVLAAAATVNTTSADSMVLGPLVGLLLPPGADLIEFMERLQLASISARREEADVYMTQVIGLLLDCAASRKDDGSIKHLLNSLRRYGPCDELIQEKVVQAARHNSETYIFEHLTNGAFANLSPNAITSLLQAGLDKGVFHSVNKLFWALADNPEAVYTPNQWHEWGSTLLLISMKDPERGPHRTLNLFNRLRQKFPELVLSPTALSSILEAWVSLHATTDAPDTKLLANLESFADDIVHAALQSSDMAQSLGVLERVVTAASHSSVSPTTPMFVQARQGVLKILNDHLVYKAADLPLVVDTLAALNVMLIKDRSRNPEWQAELQEQVALSVRQTDADLATQAKNAVLGQTLRQFADEGDTAALTALIKQLPELSVTYREVAVTALDAIQAQGNPRQYQTAYELQEAFLNEKIRFPAHVHVRYLEHVSNSNDISMVVNTFMRMKDNGIQPPRDTYATLTKTFGRTGNFKAALKVVEQMQASQQRPTLAIYHSIIQAVSRASDLKKLNRLLDLVEDDHIELNTVSYTLLARKHLRFGQPEKAATLMHTMLMKGLPVSVEAAETWLQALSEADTDLVTQLQHLHTHVTETELVVGLRFYYLFLRSIVNRLEARALEKRTDTEDSGDGANVKALLSLGWGVYDDMMAADINPSIEVLNMALALSGIECSLTRAQEVLQVIRSLQLQPQTVTYKYLADACGRADNLTAMQQTFDEYLEAFTPTDLSVFKVVIYHYGRHGNNDAAMKVYDEMIKFELVPDEELNEILVEVCGIDKTSVLINAARAEERRLAQKK